MSGRPLIAAAVDCGADEILLHRLIATRRLVDLAAKRDLRSVVWTVDDPKWLGRAERLGIHALITNNPAAMMIYLDLVTHCYEVRKKTIHESHETEFSLGTGVSQKSPFSG